MTEMEIGLQDGAEAIAGPLCAVLPEEATGKGVAVPKEVEAIEIGTKEMT
jgi:hypothetical protein